LYYPNIEPFITKIISSINQNNFLMKTKSTSSVGFAGLIAGLLFLFLAAVPMEGSAQPLTGIKTVGPAGDYATIAAAVADLNINGVGTGGVTINVVAGHVETAPVGGILLGSSALNATTSAATPILFQKSGAGANPVINAFTGTSTTVDGIWKILGTDYVTIDGVDLMEDAANTTTTTTMEWGYALLKLQNTAPFDGCQYVTIKNTNISLTTGVNGNTYGIYLGNHISTATTALTITATTDAHNNNKFFNNTITAYSGFRMNGFAAGSPYTLYDHGNEIGVDGSNTVTNYGGGSSTAYGVYAIYQNNLKINNNSFYGGTGTTTTQYGIFISTCNTANITMDNNIIDIINSALTSQVVGIGTSIGTVASTSNVVAITNNWMRITRSAATSGVTYFIYSTSNYPYIYNVSGNNIGNNSSLSGTGAVYGIYNISSIVHMNVTNNTFSHIERTGTASTAIFAAISNTASTNVATYSGNLIHSLTVGGSTGALIGISHGAGSSAVNIFNNQIYNLQHNSTGAPMVSGILVSGVGAPGANIYNNFISDLKAPTASGTEVIRGINITTTTSPRSINLYHNTIYLNATSAGANFGATGIYHTFSTTATAAQLDMRNNIVTNNSIPNGTGLTVAFRRSAATSLVNFSELSNSNCFYAGMPGASNLIYFDGTNSDQTIQDYKLRVAPREFVSFSEMPPFVNSVSAPYNLHLSTSVPTQCESGGQMIAGITTDIDNDVRAGSPGYIGTGIAPDVGADEGDFILLDLLPPVIAYTPLGNSGYATANLVATITDQTSVPTVGPGLPVLYWRIGLNGIQSPAQGTSIGNDQYSFSFGTGSVVGDTVYYYVVAQDGVLTPNVGSNPVAGAGGFTATPPAASIPPTNMNFFVRLSAMSGVYTIDNTLPTAGTNFNNFTDAVAMLNPAGLTGPVVFNVISGQTWSLACAPSPDNFGIKITNKTTTATNTVTFQKSGTAANPTLFITGTSSTGDAGIWLYEADYITFDGINIVCAGTSSADYVEFGLHLNGSAADGCSYNTFKNGLIDLSRTNTATRGIRLLSSSATSAAGTNNYNKFYNNTIQDAHQGYYMLANATFKDIGNEIGTEGSGTSVVQGIGFLTSTASSLGFYANYQDGLKISNTTFDTIVGSYTTYPTTAGLYVINSNSTHIYGNTIRQITTNAGDPVGINLENATGANAIYNNTLTGITANVSGNINSMRLFTGTGITLDVYGNEITQLTNAGSGTTNGIYCSYTNSNIDIYKNKLHNFHNTGTSGNIIYGVFLSGSGNTYNAFNNMVYDFRAPNTSGTGPAVSGFRAENSTCNLSYNTVLFDYISTSTGNTSAALYATSSAVLNSRNNIFVNNIDVTTGTRAAAFWYNSTSYGNIAPATNNNIYYCGTPGSKNFIFFNGTTGYQTYTDYKAIMTGKDQGSFSENPPFVSTVSPYNLHMRTDVMTIAEGYGLTIAGIDTDFDGDIRFGSTGYTGTSLTGTDIGADEFNGIQVPPCTGTPAAATIVGASSVCDNASANLTLSTQYTEMGISYQWGYSTTTGGPYTNMGIDPAQATGALSVNTYFVCTISCAYSGLSFTTPEKLITIIPNPTAIASSNSPLCPGDQLILTGTTDIGSSFSWTGPDNFAASTQNGGIPAVTSLNGGTYYFTATHNGCSTTGSVNVTVNPAPTGVTATASTNQTCIGVPIDLFGSAQSYMIHIDPNGDGGFESGPDFASNGWTVSNSANNPWFVGTGVSTAPFSNRSAYISNNGGVSNTYTNTTIALNYFYRDVTIPAGSSNIELKFNWVANGESTWDLIQIFTAPTTITPVGTTTYPGSGLTNVPAGISGATFVASYNLQSSIQNATIALPASLAGTTFRLIFAWKNDGSGGTAPSGSMDNISLTSVGSSATYTWTSVPAGFTSNLQNPTAVTVSVPTTFIVEVENMFGCTETASTHVDIVTGASIVSQPASTTVCAGQTASFTVVAAGPGLTYQWKFNGVDISTALNPSAGTPTLDITNASSLDAGIYEVVVSASCGTPVVSNQVLLVVTPLPLVVIDAVPSTSICPPFLLTVTHNATTPDYQWQLNGINIPGATGPTYSATASGNYTVMVTDLTTTCSALSAPATLSFHPVPSNVVVTPAYADICLGTPQQLTATGGEILVTSPSIGTGTATNTSTGYPTPYGAYYESTRHQYLVLASELTASGILPGQTIGALAFEVTALNGSLLHRNFTIKMAHTATASMTTTFETTGLTTVFGPVDYYPVDGSNNHLFNASFVWDGISNIVVDICFANDPDGTLGVTYTSNASVTRTTTAFTSVAYSYNDNMDNCPSLTAGYTSSDRANMVFSVGSPVMKSWSPVTGLYTDAAATIPYTGGAAPVVYAKPGLGTSTYTYTSVSLNSCTNSGSATLEVHPLPTASTTLPASADLCPGDSLLLSVNLTGTAPWTITVNDGTGSMVIPGIMASPWTIWVKPASTTVYSVTQVSDIFCTNSSSITFTANVNAAVPPVITGYSNPMCVNSTALLNAGAGYTSYLWSDLSTAQTLFVDGMILGPNATATYKVTVTNSFGCADSAAVTFTTYPNALFANAGTDAEVCLGSSTTLNANGIGGAGTYTGFQWSPATGLSSTTAQNPSANPLVTTTYTVVVTDADGCHATDEVVVTVLPLPVVYAGADMNVCAGSTVQLSGTVSGGSGVYTTYQWLPATGLSDATILNPLATPVSDITYQLFVTDNKGCQSSDQVSLNMKPVPTVNAGLDQSTCAGLMVFLNATPAGGTAPYAYEWAPAATLNNAFIQNPEATPQFTTTYTVTVTDANLCQATDDVVITATALPVANAGLDVQICFGQAIQLQASGGTTFQWSPVYGLNNPNISNPIASPPVTTTYTVTVASICGVASDDVVVTVNNLPSVMFVGLPNTICVNASTVNLTGAPAGGTFSGPGVVGNTFNPALAGVGGPYAITYTFTDPNACTNTATGWVTVDDIPAVPVFGYVPGNLCIDAAPYPLVGLPAGGVFSGPGVVGNTFDPALAGLGTKTLTYTVADINGCTNSNTKVVNVQPLPIVSFTGLAASYCADQAPVALTGFPAGGFFSGTGISGSSFRPIVAGPGTYTITYQYNDVYGCVNTSSQVVTVHPVPTVSFVGLQSEYCVNIAPVTLVGNMGGSNFSGVGVLGNTFNPAVAGPGYTTITYTYTNPATGCTNSVTATVNVRPVSAVQIVAPANACINGTPVTLLGSPTGGTFSGTAVTGNLFNPVTAGLGTKVITYTYTNSFGCVSSTTHNITVQPLTTTTIGGLSASYCIPSTQTVTLAGFPAGGTFSGPGISGNIFNPQTAGAGTKVITYTAADMYGCVNSTTATTVVNSTPASFTGLASSYCLNAAPVTLTGSTVGTTTGTFTGAGMIGNVFNPMNAGVGGHTVSYTLTNPATGCTGVASQYVVVHAIPVVSILNLSANQCINGAPVTVITSPSTGGTLSGPGITGNTFNPATAGLGTHTITYSFTNANNCTVTATQSVTVHGLTSVSFSGLAPSYCEQDPVALLSPAPAGGIFTGPGMYGTAFRPWVAGVGNHTVIYTFKDANGCTNTASQPVTVHANPVVNLGSDQTICINNVVTLDAGVGHTSYLWSTGETTQTIQVDGAFWKPGFHYFSVTVTNANGCAGSDIVRIIVSACTGIDENAEISNVEIYPNPSSGLVNILFNNFEGTYDMTVYNDLGQSIRTEKIDIQTAGRFVKQVDLSTHPTGIYFIKLMNDSTSKVVKVIIN
jgi:hypothetical protein